MAVVFVGERSHYYLDTALSVCDIDNNDRLAYIIQLQFKEKKVSHFYHLQVTIKYSNRS